MKNQKECLKKFGEILFKEATGPAQCKCERCMNIYIDRAIKKMVEEHGEILKRLAKE